jgi:ribose 5-phosphate isomerase A
MTIMERALEFLPDDALIGLGSGRAAQAFIRALGNRFQSGAIRVRGIATSEDTAELAREVGIPLSTFADTNAPDVTVDGADEVDPSLNLIKGYGRAMVREKIISAYSRCLLILVGEEKLVPQLGTRGKLPVEVVPFALPVCQRQLQQLGCRPVVWAEDGRPLTTDNGNNILDCAVDPISDPVRLETELRAIPGVVGTGLFLEMADLVLVGSNENFELIEERRRV